MWSIEELEKRLATLASQVEQSAANHHLLVGAKMQLEGLVMEAKKGAEVVAAIDPALVPDCSKVEQVADVVEGVVEAVAN
jgi:hypothetical protein